MKIVVSLLVGSGKYLNRTLDSLSRVSRSLDTGLYVTDYSGSTAMLRQAGAVVRAKRLEINPFQIEFPFVSNQRRAQQLDDHFSWLSHELGPFKEDRWLLHLDSGESIQSGNLVNDLDRVWAQGADSITHAYRHVWDLGSGAIRIDPPWGRMRVERLCRMQAGKNIQSSYCPQYGLEDRIYLYGERRYKPYRGQSRAVILNWNLATPLDRQTRYRYYHHHWQQQGKTGQLVETILEQAKVK